MLELLGRLALVLAMQFPPNAPVRALPESAAAWDRVADQMRANHNVAWGPGVLVNANTSKLAEALPSLDFISGVGGQRHLPLNAIVFFLDRVG